jgi:hypothetical protein
VELELDPPQPPAVAAAVAALLAEDGGQPDPWWQAGVDAALGLEPELDGQGEGTARPRSSLGADLA